jgi:sarcosine oxidase subunit gamma
MSDPVAVMKGKRFDGYVTVSQADPLGMITLRGDFNSKPFATTITKALGIELPQKREIVRGDKSTAAWMSPDELLIFCAWEEKIDLIAGLEKALEKRQTMVVDL